VAGSAVALWLGVPVPSPAQDSEWPVTTGDKGGQRYSPLDQIDADNAGDLEIAWRWSSPDNVRVAEDRRLRSRRMQPGGHQVTPIKVGDRLYATTGLSQIAALDPATGETEWVYDPEAYDAGRPTNLGFVHRGASYWPGRPAGDGAGAVPARLFYGTGDARLLAVDPFTGEPVGSFGDGGAVDLTEGLRREVRRRRAYAVSSPVMVCRDTVIVGASISDAPNHPDAPPGDIRGFDPVTEGWLVSYFGAVDGSEFGILLVDQVGDVVRALRAPRASLSLGSAAADVMRGADGTIWVATNAGIVEVFDQDLGLLGSLRLELPGMDERDPRAGPGGAPAAVYDIRRAPDGTGVWVFAFAPVVSLSDLLDELMESRGRPPDFERLLDTFVYSVRVDPDGLTLIGRDQLDTLVRPLGDGDLAFDLVDTPDGNRRVRVGRIRFANGSG